MLENSVKHRITLARRKEAGVFISLSVTGKDYLALAVLRYHPALEMERLTVECLVRQA